MIYERGRNERDLIYRCYRLRPDGFHRPIAGVALMSEQNPFAEEAYWAAWNRITWQILDKARQNRTSAKSPLKWWQTMIFWENEKRTSAPASTMKSV